MQDNTKSRIHLPSHGGGSSESRYASLRSQVESATPMALSVDSGSESGTNSSRTAAFGAGSQFVTPRVFDPAKQKSMGARGYGFNNYLNLDTDRQSRNNLYDGIEVIMKTSDVMSACREVYSRYPVAGLHLESKDNDATEFFEEIFLNELDYQEYFIDLGRDYWSYGEVFPNGVWDETLGLWVADELIDPRQIEIIQVPFSRENIITFIPDEGMKRAARGEDVAGKIFKEENPELAQLIMLGKDIVMSPDRCVHIANKNSRQDLRGTPVALKAWNTLRLQERLDSAMMATADRLYAPLLLFSLGGQLADGTPYIPSKEAISSFKGQLNTALSSDFRAMVTNQFVNVQEVIRGDKMSTFNSDLDMYDNRLFMAWGLTPSILKPESAPYATSAMEFELAAQMLSSYQRMLVKLYERRAAFVAEAHGIYDYEVHGGQKHYIEESRKVWDEEANEGEGGYVIRKTKKLLIPELKMQTINFNTTEKQRDFLMQLRKEGLPIAGEDLLIGVEIDLKASEEKRFNEEVHKAVQESKKMTAIYQACSNNGTVVPPEVLDYYTKGLAPSNQQAFFDNLMQKRQDMDGKGLFGETEEEREVSEVSQLSDALDTQGNDKESETRPGDGVRPEVSDERRKDMPKAAKVASAVEESETLSQVTSKDARLNLRMSSYTASKRRGELIAELIEEGLSLELEPGESEPVEVKANNE